MNETAREMTYEEQTVNIIMHILAMDTAFGMKRDLIGYVLGLSHRHEREIKDALYTPLSTLKEKDDAR